ncbi:hypothetical protein CON65_22345 [Bacillus pseudomycoides]|uniref:Uncharacterized protein n=1 Tax=Bacillus pseudomycoides TaxID=64104 RepID=A0AA91V8F6_9BACI|nr:MULTISPECIES: hypothetical protein [Bacillus]PEB51161.1 hypothetical protein COO03_18445 [Bacillus sp. AFS098217]PED80503.1 hypothetical protein CON65_22345 [Bacillus pseudomycoides]PEU16571.1 hypothetical protein CN524_04295 [Bacillus sp. AFS019443]PEU18934.1 hypothetical protein CN525_09245 [Bacillus sp. AFS014408]PFW65336.1 hypothetical protein COL20_01035 [Bacillus sp. AFS075034]
MGRRNDGTHIYRTLKLIAKGSKVAKFSEKAIATFQSMKHVVNPKVIGGMIQGTYNAIDRFPTSVMHYMNLIMRSYKCFYCSKQLLDIFLN